MDRAASRVALVPLLAALVAGCTGGDVTSRPAAGPGEPSGSVAMSEPPTSPAPSPPRSGAPDAAPGPVEPDDVRVAVARAAVRHLAGEIGPRPATGPAFRRAARWTGRHLRQMGYDVRRQPFQVPAGVSWGVPVRAGRSVNLIASTDPGAFQRPHLVVGAHLDTVPQAPGAEDNASGIGTLLAVAAAAAEGRTRLPVVFVVFGAEEPRGSGDDDHHYGSRHYVDRLGPQQRRAVRGMVALDRVGVGTSLPVCSAGNGQDPLREAVLRSARRAGVRAFPCAGNRASDHWSFVRSGLPGVRLGSTPYAGYHRSGDVPAVVNRGQLRRAARTTVAWLSAP